MKHTIQLDAQDTSIDIVLPNRQKIVVQFRTESNSVYVCLPEDLIVYTWQGDNREPSEQAHKGQDHVRFTKQLGIILPEAVLTKKGV